MLTLLDLHELKKTKTIEMTKTNRLDSPREANRCDDSHENSPGAYLTTNNSHHQTSKDNGVRIIDHIVSTKEGSLFIFPYKISEKQN